MDPTKPFSNPALLWRRLHGEGRMLALFVLVGAAAFVVDAVVLKAGLHLGASKALARVASLLAGMHFAFFVNRLTTFSGRRETPIARQWAKYVASNTLGALVNYGVFLALSQPGAWLEAAPVIAAGVGAACGLVVNFTGARLWAFRR